MDENQFVHWKFGDFSGHNSALGPSPTKLDIILRFLYLLKEVKIENGNKNISSPTKNKILSSLVIELKQSLPDGTPIKPDKSLFKLLSSLLLKPKNSKTKYAFSDDYLRKTHENNVIWKENEIRSYQIPFCLEPQKKRSLSDSDASENEESDVISVPKRPYLPKGNVTKDQLMECFINLEKYVDMVESKLETIQQQEKLIKKQKRER